MCVLSHMVRPVEGCRVKVGRGVLKVRRSPPHQLYLDGGSCKGSKGKPRARGSPCFPRDWMVPYHTLDPCL